MNNDIEQAVEKTGERQVIDPPAFESSAEIEGQEAEAVAALFVESTDATDGAASPDPAPIIGVSWEERATDAIAAAALRFIELHCPHPLPSLDQASVDAAPAIPSTAVRFRIPAELLAAAVTAVALPTRDQSVLETMREQSREDAKKTGAKLQRCQIVLCRDRVRVVNARDGVQCEQALPLAEAPTGLVGAMVAFEVPVHSFFGFFLSSTYRIRNRARQQDPDRKKGRSKAETPDWQRLEPVTFAYEAVRKTFHVQFENAHFQIEGTPCVVPPVIPALPQDAPELGTGVVRVLDRLLGEAATFINLNGPQEHFKVISLKDGVATGGSNAAATRARSTALAGLSFSISIDAVKALRSVLRRLDDVQLSAVDGHWVLASGGFSAAVQAADYDFPELRWDNVLESCPRYWTVPLTELLPFLIMASAVQTRDSDKRPTLTSLSVVDEGGEHQLKVSVRANSGNAYGTFPVRAVEQQPSHPSEPLPGDEAAATCPSPHGEVAGEIIFEAIDHDEMAVNFAISRTEEVVEQSHASVEIAAARRDVAVAEASPRAEVVVGRETTIRHAYLLNALSNLDRTHSIDLFLINGYAIVRRRLDDVTAVHALSSKGRYRDG